MREVILECDTPSEYTGRIYPLVEVKKMLEDYGNKPVLGENDQPEYLPVNLEKSVIQTTNLELVGTTLYGETTALEGKEVDWEDRRGSIRATGNVDENGVVTNIKLYAIDLLKEQIVEKMKESVD